MEQNAAIVTGASSGIGLAIAKKLTKEGYRVFGFGRQFPEEVPFEPVVCDFLQGVEPFLSQVKELQKQFAIKVVVHAAGVAYYGLHEEMSPKKIHEMVLVNAEVPMALSQQLLRDLKQNKGTMVMISSVTATHASPHACTYGATKAALSAFAESLFEEARKYGVRVVTIQPDMTRTNLYRNADFTGSDEIDECLEPEEIADAVCMALTARDGLVLREITLRPQKNKIVKKKN